MKPPHVPPRTGRLMMWLIAVGVVAFLFVSNNQQSARQHEQAVRQHEQDARHDRQFCHLVVATHDDRVARYAHTIEYLKSPVGQAHTGLNDYIRKISLPQSRAEIAREASLIPESCRHG